MKKHTAAAESSLSLSPLTCPECHNPFTLRQGTVRDGIAECACRQMVVLCGVVHPANGLNGRRLIAAFLAGGESARRAVLGRVWLRVRLLELTRRPVTFRRFIPHAALGRVMATRRMGKFFGRLSGYAPTRRFWGAGQWNLYLRHRFTTPSFLAARGALGLLDGRHGLVLDAGCGTGHLLHNIGRLVDPSRVVALDVDPVKAYAARQFFLPAAAAVLAWDLNEPLPLADGSVGAAFCLDAFHYVSGKRELAREFVRVLNDDGVLAILHLHNRLQYNPSPGSPLSPAEYRDLFPGCVVRMYREEDFLRAHLRGEPLDLSASAPAALLDSASALMLLVAKNPDALTVLEPVRSTLAKCAVNPQVAELYSVRGGKGEVVLERFIPSTLRAEYPEMEEILPGRLACATVTSPRGRLEFVDQQALLEGSILIDLPERF